MTIDELWDALRAAACTTKPYTDAQAIVMPRRDDVTKALAMLRKSALLKK